jgi:hypothetical protein
MLESLTRVHLVPTYTQELVISGLDQLKVILQEYVLVLFDHTSHFVSHLRKYNQISQTGRSVKKVTVTYITGVMAHEESFSTHVKVLVARATGQSLTQGLVSTFSNTVHGSADVVENGHQTRRVLAFEQVAHNLVVEVVNRLPLDTL